jgi:hypothetical protein
MFPTNFGKISLTASRLPLSVANISSCRFRSSLTEQTVVNVTDSLQRRTEQGSCLYSVSGSFEETFFVNGGTDTSGPGPPNFRGFKLKKFTLCRNPLDEKSVRHRDLYPHNAKNLKQTDVHVIGEIRTRNPRKRTVIEPRCRVRDHWVRRVSNR